MRHTVFGLLLVCLLGAGVVPHARAQSSLTLYSDGRVLVRQTVALRVPRGTSEQDLEMDEFDPASLVPLDSGVTILAADYTGRSDEGSTIRRAVGEHLTFWRPLYKDTVTAVVRNVAPLQLELPDGRILFQSPGTPLYPGRLVSRRSSVHLRLLAERARDSVRLAYFTDGATWRSAYDLVLQGKRARILGKAVVMSSALEQKGAELQLLAGEVQRVFSFNRGGGTPSTLNQAPFRSGDMVELSMASVNVSGGNDLTGRQGVGEFYVYTLPGRHDLVPGHTTSAPLFEPATTTYEQTYEIEGRLPPQGQVFGANPNEAPVPVQTVYTVSRARNTEFGGRPLPAGGARLYHADQDGRLQLLSEATVRHVSPGEDLRFYLGEATGITATRTEHDFLQEFDSIQVRPGFIQTRPRATVLTYEVRIRNASDTAATVDIIERRRVSWAVVSSSVAAEKRSPVETRFRVPVPPGEETLLTYRVRFPNQ